MSTKNDTTASEAVLIALLFPFALAFFICNMGLAAKLTWNLIMPQFYGLPVLTLPVAILTICTLSVLRSAKVNRVSDNRTSDEKRDDAIMIILSPWVVYLIAVFTKNFFY